MKKIISLLCILVLSMTLFGCSDINNQSEKIQDYPRPLDILSVKPIMTCNVEGEEEVMVAVKNYMSSGISDIKVEIVSKDTNESLATFEYNEIKADSTIDIYVKIPNGVKYNNASIKLVDYTIQK